MKTIYNQNPELQNKSACVPSPAPGPSGLGVGDGTSSCLFSNNSIERTHNHPPKLSSYHKKQAQTLYSNVSRLIKFESPSINHVAFLTLTFQKNITDHKEAYERFRSFNSNFLSSHPVYGSWISVKEHQARGAWHFHMIIQLTEDIRTGFDFDQYDTWLKGPRKKGTFPTGNAQIRSLWAELDKVLPEYGFGRIFTLEPIKSNEEAVSRYVGKYVSKQIGQRPESDKGVRLINYSRGWLRNSLNMAWHNDNARLWRKKVAIFARIHGCQELYQLSERLGPNWAYKYTQEIMEITEQPEHFLDDLYGKEQEFEERLNIKIKENLAIRKKKENERASLSEEEKQGGREKLISQINLYRRKEKDRSAKVRKHKNKLNWIMGQKWHTSQENINDVKEVVRQEMESAVSKETINKRVREKLDNAAIMESISHKKAKIIKDQQIEGVPF